MVGRGCVITQAEKGAPGTGPSIWALKTNKHKQKAHGIPSCPVVKAPHCRGEGSGLLPGWGIKIPHAELGVKTGNKSPKNPMCSW